MKLARLQHDPGALADFYEASLESLGALCERSWHDALRVIAEGRSARLWNDDGSLHEIELQFVPAGSSGPREAARDIFPGCPLTFRLAEALLPDPPAVDRVVWSVREAQRPPLPEVALKLWRAQWPGDGVWRLESPFRPVHHFSLVALVRAEIQAIDQHWFLHRVAVALCDGQADESLAQSLEFAEIDRAPNPAPAWPGWDPVHWRSCLDRVLAGEIAPDLTAIRERQQRHLQRELDRIDDYFEGYLRELEQRSGRAEGARLKARERVAAARAEHERRRADQLHRHEVRVVPRFDALLLVAEPAWEAVVTSGPRGDVHTLPARFVPRSRRWHPLPARPGV